MRSTMIEHAARVTAIDPSAARFALMKCSTSCLCGSVFLAMYCRADSSFVSLLGFRRTCATEMGNLGVAPHVIEAVLSQVSGEKAGVAGVYNIRAYAPEKKAALE
jgi:hypothetical protein